MKHGYILFLIIPLTSCSYITDYLLKDQTGISVDAQLGSNENKVKTGIGSVGVDKDTSLQIEDSSDITVQNSDDRYHITTEGDTTVNVYETNRWLYLLFGLLAFGKPALNWLWSRKKKIKPHERVTYTTTSRVATVYRDKQSARSSNNSTTHTN